MLTRSRFDANVDSSFGKEVALISFGLRPLPCLGVELPLTRMGCSDHVSRNYCGVLLLLLGENAYSNNENCTFQFWLRLSMARSGQLRHSEEVGKEM